VANPPNPALTPPSHSCVSFEFGCIDASPGNGNYGRAFARKVEKSAVPVAIGSRNPHAAVGDDAWGQVCEVMSVSDALSQADIVMLAIPHDAYADFAAKHAAELGGKTLVDVSNPVTPGLSSCIRSIYGKMQGRGVEVVTGTESSAQRLSAALAQAGAKGCNVVKAFNNIAAYELDNGGARNPPPVVTVSGDSERAKSLVMNLARRMGFATLDFGGLRSSIIQEQTVHRFFDGWISASVVTLIVTVLVTVYWANVFYVGKQSAVRIWYSWILLPAGDISAILLSITFLAGSFAAILQLIRGTARRPFPAWLGTWMNIRKQLGLIAFFFAAIHAVAGCLHGAPHEMGGKKPGYNDYTYITFGVLAFAVFAVLAGSSGTVVAQGQMSWIEFKFVFGTLGYVTLALLLVHIAYLIPGWLSFLSSNEAAEFGYKNKVPVVYFSLGFVCLTLLLKIVLFAPPVSWKLASVRRK
jgi:predicted dinucleotide-binding enzyme/DMSO/TMAO reductase YedYZ heme-binding membrane subunit